MSNRRPSSLILRLSSLLLAAAGAIGAARALELDLPVACTPGTDCWVLNYVDVDPGPGVRDGACGARSYDGHDGTDFAIRDLDAMAKGVEVRATAAGVVTLVRDGMRDAAVSTIGRDAVKGQECGNGLLLDHGQGWETQYCHMQQASIVVKRGDRVAVGQRLGFVGLSGMTEFPHIHLTIRRWGKALDPFTGRPQNGLCGGDGAASLWRRELRLAYDPVALFNAGVSAAPPSQDSLRGGIARQEFLRKDAPALVLWFEALGVKHGDIATFRLIAPDGRAVFETRQILSVESTEQRAYEMLYAGGQRKATAAPWPTGTYRGVVTLTRAGAPPIERTIETQMEVR